MLRVTIQATVEAAWMAVASVRLGLVPAGLPTPDAYVCLAGDDGPLLRIDLWKSGGECHAFTAAEMWGSLVVIGWGESVHAVEVRTQQVQTIPLGSYFGHLYPGQDHLLVASAERLHAVRPDGSVAWRSDVLGLDGVLVHDLADDTIHGRGEWDPPGGWRDFTISRITGRFVP
jgi:hypothetical protein